VLLHKRSRPLINYEESDEDSSGGYISHFELYYDAMAQSGADTSRIDNFLEKLGRGETVHAALERSGVPQAVHDFVLTTWRIVETHSTVAIASAFTLGRENLIPSMFRSVIANSGVEGFDDFYLFRYYLERHIDLDEDQHTPMAMKMLAAVCGDNQQHWEEALVAARESLGARLALWDGLIDELKSAPDPDRFLTSVPPFLLVRDVPHVR
jgi:Protein of unknown function (DUF3050)